MGVLRLAKGGVTISKEGMRRITAAQRKQLGWSRRSAGDAPTERTSRMWHCFRGHDDRQERRRVQRFLGAEISKGGVRRLVKGGATYSRTRRGFYFLSCQVFQTT